MAKLTQRHRRQHRALHAMRDAFTKDRSRRIAGIAAGLHVVADLIVKKLLDFLRRLQAAENLAFSLIEHARQVTSLLLYSLMSYARTAVRRHYRRFLCEMPPVNKPCDRFVDERGRGEGALPHLL